MRHFHSLLPRACAAAACASGLFLPGCLLDSPDSTQDSEAAYAASPAEAAYAASPAQAAYAASPAEAAYAASPAQAAVTLSSPIPSRGFWINNEEIALAATVTDPATVTKVVFRKDGVQIAELPGNGQTRYSWKYLEPVPGGYNYSVSVYDIYGNRSTSALLPLWIWFRYQSFDRFPIADMGGMTYQIPISAAAGKIRDVRIQVGITHTWDSDLVISTYHWQNSNTSPTVVLANRLGGSGDNYNGTTFRDDASTSILNSAPPFAGSFKPQESLLGKLWGRPATGYLYVTVKDVAPADSGYWDWLEAYVKVGP